LIAGPADRPKTTSLYVGDEDTWLYLHHTSLWPHSLSTFELYIAHATRVLPSARKMQGRSLKAGSWPPWLGLGATTWVKVTGGASSTFVLYSHALKVSLGAIIAAPATFATTSACSLGCSTTGSTSRCSSSLALACASSGTAPHGSSSPASRTRYASVSRRGEELHVTH
jgi:hypothetical protein